MKKRQMKKWIPKNTIYCYSFKNGKYNKCKWHKYIKTIKYNKDIKCPHNDDCDENDKCWEKPSSCCRVRVYRCEYLGFTDWNEDSLLWDECKECGIGGY